MTEGVTVITAATMKFKPVWIVVGIAESACMRVVYEAMMMGGRGGRAGCAGGGGTAAGFDG